MTAQMTKSNRMVASTKRGAFRSVCGAVAATLAISTVAIGQGGVVEAAPAQPQAPASSQSFVGLRHGAVGSDVAAVQKALIAAGIKVPGGADGRFGIGTHGALVEFQKTKGLASTGEVDAATADALGLSSSTPTTPTVVAVNGLQEGVSGDAVKELQQKLAAAGVYVAGGADGKFGKATTTAVSNYQTWNGLKRTGVVDEATAKRLGLTGSTSTTTAPPPPADPPAASNPYVGLKVGSRGAEVKELQQALISSGLLVRGGADGVFGFATRTTLKAFQKIYGLSQTGAVGNAEVKKLKLGTPADPAPTTPPPATKPPADQGNPYVGLGFGSRGDLVKHVQQALIREGVAVRGGADGVFGSATTGALAEYQKANGLGVSGKVFVATAQRLGLGVAAPDPLPKEPQQPSTASNGYVGLAMGARGAKVKELQQALIGTGLVLRGGADGVFGYATRASLKSFQSAHGITQTGVVTEKGSKILHLGNPDADPKPNPAGFAVIPDGFPKKGESSERVRILQQRLIDWGINVVGGADGSFGNATASAISKFQTSHGLSVTGTVTQKTAEKMGLKKSDPNPPVSATSVKIARFPVQGQCYFGNTWHAPRGNGRMHEGVDIIAAEGNLLYAVVDGTITKQYWDQPGALAGNGLRVAEDDGTYFTYLHMKEFAPGIKVGTKVRAGDVIGFVGNTGSSATPHVHFEIHPGGGAAVNPYPYVLAVNDCSNRTPQYQSSFS